jgi:alpha-ketoglutarate-dependent taurine dioxygenase
MFEYTLHSNSWTIIINEFDLKEATQNDINYLARLLANNICVVIRNQSLSVSDQLRIINMFKDPEPLLTPDDENFADYAADLNLDPIGIICRVTGETNEHGKEGIAGHIDEMRWHCNHPYREGRKPLVWLYGVRGTKGSRTSWNNNILSYNDLDEDIKKKLSNLKIITKKGLENTESDNKNSGQPVHNFTPNVVYTNNANKTGLFFPFLQISQFEGMSIDDSEDLIKEIGEFTIQEKYCYHHDWEDGDLVISEQWLSTHKRWKFESISKRLLHRAAFDFPDQNYNEDF